MKVRLLLLGTAALSACAVLPPNGISHARFARPDATSGLRTGFSVAAHATEDAVTIPVADGSVVVPLSDHYDASVVAQDGLAHYEGLLRFTPRFGLLHGLGLGFPSLGGRDTELAISASVGVFGQVGPSFFAAASYAPHRRIAGSSSTTHFVNAEVGWSFGTRVQFAPALTGSWYALERDLEPARPALLGLVGLTVMVAP